MLDTPIENTMSTPVSVSAGDVVAPVGTTLYDLGVGFQEMSLAGLLFTFCVGFFSFLGTSGLDEILVGAIWFTLATFVLGLLFTVVDAKNKPLLGIVEGVDDTENRNANKI